MIFSSKACGSLLVITFAVATLSIAAQASAAAKPLSSADKAEGRALFDEYVKPIRTDMTAAVALAVTDVPGACDMAKATEQKALVLRTKFEALRTRLTAEGKTTEGFEDVDTYTADDAHREVNELCTGILAKTGDAEHDRSADKLISLSATLRVAMEDATEALGHDDHAKACAHIRQAINADTELLAYISNVRAGVQNGTADATRIADAIANATFAGEVLAHDLDHRCSAK